MKIVVLGPFTEYKKFFMLNMARLLASFGSVRAHAHKPYAQYETSDAYEIFRVMVHPYQEEEDLKHHLSTEPADYELIDMTTALNLGSEVKAISFCEPERGLFEAAADQTKDFSRIYPFTDIVMIYSNLLEYSKINANFLGKMLERQMAGTVNILKHFELYYEERNSALFIESMYQDRYRFVNLSPAYKHQLMEIVETLTGINGKLLKKGLKKAERVKSACK